MTNYFLLCAHRGKLSKNFGTASFSYKVIKEMRNYFCISTDFIIFFNLKPLFQFSLIIIV